MRTPIGPPKPYASSAGARSRCDRPGEAQGAPTSRRPRVRKKGREAGTAGPGRSRKPRPARRPRPPRRGESRPELLHHRREGLVVGILRERGAPDLLRLVALPDLPQHFAEMRGDLGIVSRGIGGLEVLQRLARVAEAIVHPAQAVEDERIVRLELERLLDQVLRL